MTTEHVDNTVQGYLDASARNETIGGLGAHAPELTVDDANASARQRVALSGPAAYRTVVYGGGVAALAWYYCASAFELGVSSSYDAMVTALDHGGHQPFRAESSGPNEHQIRSASLQGAVMRRLRKLEPRHQAVLEAAYEDRTYPTEVVIQQGHGVVALLARAEAQKRTLQNTWTGRGLAALQRFVMVCCGRKKAAPPWEPIDPVAARALLRDAHEAYLGSTDPTPTRRRRKRQLSLVPAGESGARARRLVREPARGVT